MHDFEENAKTYLETLKASRALRHPKNSDIPFKISTRVPVTELNAHLTNRILPRLATVNDYKHYPLLNTDAVLTAEGCKTEMIRRPAEGEICIIDWVTIVMQSSSFDDSMSMAQPHAFLRQNAIVENVSKVLTDILGFGVADQNKAGRNFYQSSYNLQHKAGYICIGGQNETIMICLSGVGCTYGKAGWESHLNAWLRLYAKKARITRIDLAHDDLHGENVSLDWFDDQDTIGGFVAGGRRPTIEKRGNWKRPSGKGRTLYIGSRQSSKFTRIYEKGKQLGDVNSLWVRTEVEYKNRDIFIDFDVLLNPSQFFLASYPCFHIFDDQENALRFERIEKQNLITFDQAMSILKHQYGRYVNFFRDVYQDDKTLLDEITDIENKNYPERIDPLTIPQMSH